MHIHSAYSRATSKDLTPIALEAAARRKGIQLLATGDFTHPVYRDMLKQVLMPLDNGLFALKQELLLPQNGALARAEQTRFIISGEISSIYKKNGRTRKVHNVILLPTLDAAEKISAKLESLGCNLPLRWTAHHWPGQQKPFGIDVGVLPGSHFYSRAHLGRRIFLSLAVIRV